MRILITGISGFVARHFVELLSTLNEPVHIAGIYNNHLPQFSEDDFTNIKCDFHKIDLLDSSRLREVLLSFRPDYILHLASKSSVAYSWKHPSETIKHNTGIFISLIENIRLLNLDCRLLSVGSAEEYGNAPKTELPLIETHCPNPVSPYGTSRVMQQKLVEIYSKNYGLDMVHTRSFNHIGPGQKESFVISSFAKQLVGIANNHDFHQPLIAGDLSIVRDFVDVRDVVKAYYMLLMQGANGNVYNICSGKGISLNEILSKMCSILNIQISIEEDPNLIRPNDTKITIGSYAKLKALTGWTPTISIDQSLSDIIAWWKQSVLVTQ
ncbi:MAG: GDP-mannose 4,6-dehydratase [Ferruginibacter sp.]